MSSDTKVHVYSYSKAGMRRGSLVIANVLFSFFSIILGALAGLDMNSPDPAPSRRLAGFVMFYGLVFTLCAYPYFFPRKAISFQMDFFIFEGGFGIARSHSINIYPWEILHKLAIFRDRNGNLRQAQLQLTRHETITVTNFENSGGALEQIRDHSAGKLPVVESPWRFYHSFAVQLVFIPLCTLAGFLIGSLL